MTTTHESPLTIPRAELATSTTRELAIGLAGALALGAAAGSGLGVTYAARGAALSPALFGGGALLALPPLYLCASWADTGISLSTLVAHTAKTFGALGRALLGLAVPAAFLSATIRTSAGLGVLWVVLAVSGLAAVLRQASLLRTGKQSEQLWLAVCVWGMLSLGIGARLMFLLSRHLGGAS